MSQRGECGCCVNGHAPYDEVAHICRDCANERKNGFQLAETYAAAPELLEELETLPGDRKETTNE